MRTMLVLALLACSAVAAQGEAHMMPDDNSTMPDDNSTMPDDHSMGAAPPSLGLLMPPAATGYGNAPPMGGGEVPAVMCGDDPFGILYGSGITCAALSGMLPEGCEGDLNTIADSMPKKFFLKFLCSNLCDSHPEQQDYFAKQGLTCHIDGEIPDGWWDKEAPPMMTEDQNPMEEGSGSGPVLLPANLEDFSHAVSATVALTGYTVDTFDSTAQAAFVEGTAAALGVPAETVVITDISAARRRRLLQEAVTVEFYVLAETEGAGQALAAALVGVQESGELVAALQAAGLADVQEVTMVEAPQLETAAEVMLKFQAASSPLPPVAPLFAALSAALLACL